MSKLEYYDRATNKPITFESRPSMCIEPVAQLTVYKDGQKYAALVNLKTRQEQREYKRTFTQKLLRRPADTYFVELFDFKRAADELKTGSQV